VAYAAIKSTLRPIEQNRSVDVLGTRYVVRLGPTWRAGLSVAGCGDFEFSREKNRLGVRSVWSPHLNYVLVGDTAVYVPKPKPWSTARP
jgi:hypothetical protein